MASSSRKYQELTRLQLAQYLTENDVSFEQCFFQLDKIKSPDFWCCFCGFTLSSALPTSTVHEAMKKHLCRCSRLIQVQEMKIGLKGRLTFSLRDSTPSQTSPNSQPPTFEKQLTILMESTVKLDIQQSKLD